MAVLLVARIRAAAALCSPQRTSRALVSHPSTTFFSDKTILSMNAVDDTPDTAQGTAPSQIENIRIPLSFEEMVKQASSAMEDAYRQGMTRQIVRVLLPRSATNDQLLQYYEDDAENGLGETVLVPTDETWQGGIMQLYRAASYTCQAILR